MGALRSPSDEADGSAVQGVPGPWWAMLAGREMAASRTMSIGLGGPALLLTNHKMV